MMNIKPLNRLPLALSTLVVFMLAPLQPLSADELIMKDGSRLIGEVVARKKVKEPKYRTLEFKTSYAGVIQVKWHDIAEIKTDKPMEFMLTDESLVKVTRLTNNADDMIVETEAGLPPQTLGQDVVAVINPEPWQKGEGFKFTGRANLAFERERGNTDEDNLDIDGDLTWRRKKDRFTAFGELEYDKKDNKNTADNWKVEGAYNYFFRPKWFWGGFGRFEHDENADLKLRSSIGPLIGYQWFESKDLNLRASAGPVYVDEDFYDDEDDNYPALGWGVNYDQFLFKGFVQIYHRQVGFWNLDSTSDLVWDSWNGLRFPLVLGLVASTELKIEYDGGAAEGADDLDTTYYLKLGYAW